MGRVKLRRPYIILAFVFFDITILFLIAAVLGDWLPAGLKDTEDHRGRVDAVRADAKTGEKRAQVSSPPSSSSSTSVTRRDLDQSLDLVMAGRGILTALRKYHGGGPLPSAPGANISEMLIPAAAALPLGTQVPDVSLKRVVDDGEVDLAKLWKNKPVLVIFASFT